MAKRHKVKRHKVPEVISFPTVSDRKLYFDNNRVEDLLLRYLWGNCTDVPLRDEIMGHAEELIQQIIRAHGLHKIYKGYEDSAFGDLFQTAWTQIERVLYKYKARPHCYKCYQNRRPQESVVYQPGQFEYGVISPEEIARRGLRCPCCKKVPDKILYRGTSKVFNLFCVRPDTLIYTTNGINTIENVVKREGYNDKQEIWTLGLCGSPRKIIAGVSKFKRPILNIKTKLGLEIGCTPSHGIMHIGGWKSAASTEIGDLIGIQYNQQFFVNNDKIDIELTPNNAGCNGVLSPNWHYPHSFNTELSYILGLYIAEGTCSKGQVNIYNTDHDIINKLLGNRLGLKFTHHPNNRCVICCNKRFAEFIRNLKFGSRAHVKEIPQQLLAMSKNNIISMLSGMFDGDGHSSRFNGTVGYTSTSKKLIDQVRMLLLNIGILPKLQYDNRTTSEFYHKDKKYISPRKAAYQIMLSTCDSNKFYDEIGFGCDHKQIKRKYLKSPKRFVYGVNESFRKLYKKYRCGDMGYDKIRSAIKPHKTFCEINYAAKLVKNWEQYNDDVDYILAKNVVDEYLTCDTKTIWLPVVDISKSESSVCEISVESSDSSYIANGIVSHNSQVARTVILAFIKKESRDYKNSEPYKIYLDARNRVATNSGVVGVFDRFLKEAKEVFRHNSSHMIIVNALSKIIQEDDRPYEGIITKLVDRTSLPRSQIACFLKEVRIRSCEFTDSPINEEVKPRDARRRDIQFEED